MTSIQFEDDERNWRRSSCTNLSTMKKAGSVGCGLLRYRHNPLQPLLNNCQSEDSNMTATIVASQFSRRAARGSYSNKSVFGSQDEISKKVLPFGRNLPQSISAQTSFGDEEDVRRIWLPRISLVKLSVIFLAFATVTDLAWSKMNDVDKPRTSLGSAAISSVTNTLSPILPFAGGLDLRRDDYWTPTDGQTWWDTLSSVYIQVQDAFSHNSERTVVVESTASSPIHQSIVTPISRVTSSYVMSISAQKPFVDLNSIAELTLGDVAELLRWAIDSSNADYSLSLDSFKPSVRKVILGMDEAVRISRGAAQNWVRSAYEDQAGQVDVLKFSATMRIFAEWRLVRQVPDGYKGYAVGMSLGHKDVVQNIVKIEQSVHEYLEYQKVISSAPLQTPTLRQLLKYEIESGVHRVDKLPRLTEKSAGMGLLWVRRQMAYQVHIYRNFMNVKNFASTRDAISAAYTEVYDKYHGWAVQKIFNYSFKAAPEPDSIFRHMNPHRLKQLMNTRPTSNGSVSDVPTETLIDENPFGQFLNHVGKEWDKFATNFIKIVLKKKDTRTSQQSNAFEVRGGDNGAESNTIDNEYITQEMVKDAVQQMDMFLKVASPFLDNVATLFDDLNMDDPTRV